MLRYWTWEFWQHLETILPFKTTIYAGAFFNLFLCVFVQAWQHFSRLPACVLRLISATRGARELFTSLHHFLQRALDKENENHLKQMPLIEQVFYLQLIMAPTRAPRLPSTRQPPRIEARLPSQLITGQQNYDLCQCLVLCLLKKNTETDSETVLGHWFVIFQSVSFILTAKNAGYWGRNKL